MDSIKQQFDHTDNLNQVVDRLHEGQRILVNDRSVALEVIDVDSEAIGSDTYETRTVYLEGRGGRVYRIRGEYGCGAPVKIDTTPPLLEIRQERGWVTPMDSSVTNIAIEDLGEEIVADITAGEWLSEAGIDVR